MKNTPLLSVCVPFYPWYREHDRTDEVFDVLIKGLNCCDNSCDIELCLVDSGVADVWGMNRIHYSRKFHNRAADEFNGSLNYIFDENSIHVDENGTKRFWAAAAIDKAVRIANSDRILIFGIDCFAPKDLIDRHKLLVHYGKSWVIISYNIPAFQKFDKALPYSGWHTARGIVGIMKDDYVKIGGYNKNYIKDRSDSDFYLRMIDKLDVYENKEEGFFHINHPGSNACRIWRLEDAQIST